MENDYSEIEKEIQLIELLFQNKQLDQFIERVQNNIIPYLSKQQHLLSDHLIEKQQAHLNASKSPNLPPKQPQPKNIPPQSEKQKPQPKQISKLENHLQTVHQKSSESHTVELAKQEVSNKSLSQNPQIDPKTLQADKQEKLSKDKAQQIAKALKNAKINILQKYEEMKLVLFKIQRQMKKLQTPMTDKGQWKVNKINSTSSIGVKTKGTLIQIRYQGIVETNIFNLCVMIYLSQLWKQWVPFCTNSKTIAQPSSLEKVVLIDLKIPFLTQRYAYLHGVAADRITKNGKLYIYAEGITDEKDLLINVHKVDKNEYEKKVSKSVVLDAKYMVAQIGNQGNGKYMVKVYGMLDSHMPLLPQKIVNYIVKQLGGMIFDKIVQRAKDIKNTPWQKELKQNEKRQVKNMFYDWLNQRIKNWDKTQTARKSKI